MAHLIDLSVAWIYVTVVTVTMEIIEKTSFILQWKFDLSTIYQAESELLSSFFRVESAL